MKCHKSEFSSLPSFKHGVPSFKSVADAKRGAGQDVGELPSLQRTLNLPSDLVVRGGKRGEWVGMAVADRHELSILSA